MAVVALREIPKVLRGSSSWFFDSVALINPGRLSHSILGAGTADKLPQSRRRRVGNRSRLPGAFHLTKPRQIFRHAGLTESIARNLHVTARATQTVFHRRAATSLIIVNKLLNQRICREIKIKRVLSLFERIKLIVRDTFFVLGENQLAERIQRRRLEALLYETDLLLRLLNLRHFDGFDFRICWALRNYGRRVLLRRHLNKRHFIAIDFFDEFKVERLKLLTSANVKPRHKNVIDRFVEFIPGLLTLVVFEI